MTQVYDDYNAVLPAAENDYAYEVRPLEPGEYPFTVVKCEPGVFEPRPDNKAPACKSMTVTICVEHAQKKHYISKDLLLYSDLAWLLRQFFISIGLGKHGEPIAMNWTAAKGRRGLAKITKTAGRQEGVWFNNIDKFLVDPKVSTPTSPSPPPVAPPPPVQEEEIPFDF